MRARLVIAMCVLPLLPVDQAAAQHVVDSRNGNVVPAPPSGPLSSGIGIPATRTKGLHVDRYAYVAEDGGADVRNGIVGTMPIADNASVGVGLYRVSRYSSGEPNFRKLRPMEDVDGRHQRIAAVGMSVRF